MQDLDIQGTQASRRLQPLAVKSTKRKAESTKNTKGTKKKQTYLLTPQHYLSLECNEVCNSSTRVLKAIEVFSCFSRGYKPRPALEKYF